jgi:hypothetical protein
VTETRAPKQDAALGGVGQLLALALAAVAAAVVAPALLAGTALPMRCIVVDRASRGFCPPPPSWRSR